MAFVVRCKDCPHSAQTVQTDAQVRSWESMHLRATGHNAFEVTTEVSAP